MMKKKLAMLLAVIMTATSIESSALAVSGADFGSDPVEVTAEAEALPETLTTEPEEEIFAAEPGEQTENGAAEVSEEGTTTSEVPEAEVLFGSGEEETAPETEEQTPEVPDTSEEVILQEENTSAEEGASQEAVFSDGELTVEEDFAAEAGTVIPQDGVTPLGLSVDYPVNIAAPGEKVWFSFTPSEAGKYSFSSTSEDGEVDAQGFLYDAQGVELSSDDQGNSMGNNDFLLKYNLEAGQTYYYCAQSYYNYKTGFFTVRLEKQRSIETVTVENLVTDVPEGFGNLGQVAKRSIITVTYADGTETYVYTVDGDWTPSFTDPYGNYIYSQYLNEDGSEADMYNPKAGTYQIQLKCDDVVLGKYPIQIVPVEESRRYGGELQNGENQIIAGDDEIGSRIFKYIPSETAEYAFVGAGDITVKAANPAGGLADVTSDRMKCTMEQGKSYYLEFSYYGECTVKATKSIDIQEISLENITVDVPEKFGTLYETIEHAVFTVTYADGTEPYVYTNAGDWISTIGDPYGNQIDIECLSEDGSEADWYDPKAGSYTIQLKCDNAVLGTYQIQIVPVEESRRYGGELQNGENQIIAGDDEIGSRIFKYIPSETAEYAFVGAGDITVKAVNPAGGLEDVESNGMKCAMEQGKSYYLTFSWGGENTVYVIKAVNASSVSVDTSEAKTEFLAGLERYSPKGMKLNVSYEDGSSEILTYEYEHDTEVRDSKGNIFSYRIWKVDKEFDQWDNLNSGTYEIRIQCNYEEIPGVSYTVTFGEGENLRVLQKGINRQVESKDGEDTWYRFTPDTDALYLFDPVGNITVYKKINGGTPEYQEPYATGAFKLEAEAEYLISLYGEIWIENPETGEEDSYNTFDMEIREIPELTGIQAKVTQTEGLAGISYYTGAELVCTYSDKTSETIKWNVGRAYYEDSKKGMCISNIITDKDGNEHYLGDSLAAGTYSLKFRNGTNVESNPVEIRIESDITKTSLLTGEVYEGRNLDMESPLSRCAYYSFTSENEGIYTVETTMSYGVPFIRKTKDGYEYAGTDTDLETGETVYICTYGGNYNDTSESCNIHIYSPDDSKTLSWNKSEVTVNSRLDERNPWSEIPAVLYETEENGVTRAYEVTYEGECYAIDYSEDSGLNNVNVEIQDNKTGEIHNIHDFDGETLPEGSYTITVISYGVKSSPLKLNVQNAGFEQYQKLVEKEQTVPVGNLSNYVYYTFCPEISGTYGLTTDLDDLGISVTVVSEDGGRYDLYHVSKYMGNAAFRMDAGKTYVLGLSDESCKKTQAKVTLKKLPELKELKINSFSPEKQEYIANMDAPRCVAEVEVCFEDGTSQILSTGYYSQDLYGRNLICDFVKKLENGTYEKLEFESPLPEPLPAGEYAGRIVFDGREDKAVYIPVKVTALKDYDATVLEENGKTSIENPGTHIKLQYTAKEDGRYEFRFNVHVNNISIFTEQGEKIAEDEYSYTAHNLYADLKKGVYDICLKVPEDKITTLSAEVSFLTQKVEGLKAIISKNTYIAGYDRTYMNDLLTEVTINGKTYKVRGLWESNGYSLWYRIENGKEEIEYNQPLSAGTWTITPYLKNQSDGKIILEGTPVTIQAVLPDFDNLPALTEDWMEIEDTGNGAVYYKFTAPKTGVYSYETEFTQDSDWIYAQLYKINGNMLKGNGFNNRQLTLEKNETCFVAVNSSGGGKIRFTGYPCVTEGSIVLQDGTDIYVNQTAEEITAEFTPKESGYYKLELEGMDSVTIMIGGEYCGSSSCEYLYKDRTYRYVLSQGYFNPKEVAYRLTYKKMDQKKVKDVSLVVNEDFIADNPLLSFTSACQKIVTYEDGTTSEPMSIYEEDAYGNKFKFHSKTSSLKTDKEIIFDTYFEYRMSGETKWHKTKVQKTTIKGTASYPAMELNKTYTAKSNASTVYSFIPPESGQYILSLDGSGVERWYVYCEEGNEYLQPEGEGVYSIDLSKGYIYGFQISNTRYAKEDISFTLRRKKGMKDLELVKAPDHPNCYIDGVEMASLTGMQVKAIYTDNSTEIITYGETDSCGRRLSFSSLEWIDAEHGRVYAELGGYRVAFDVTSGDLQQAQNLQSSTSLKASKGERIPVQYTAAESGRHEFDITGGYFCESYRDKDGYYYELTGVSDFEPAAYLQKGQTYYFYVIAEEENPSISVSFGGHRWVKDTNKSVDPTCTTDGKLVEYCELHQDETRTTDLPKLGHDLGEWKTTVEPTCTTDGERQRTCKRSGCSYKETEAVKSSGHSFGEWSEIPATCTEDGSRTHTCSICKTTETETIKALGHDWGEEQRIEPTETTSGKIYRICQRCQEEEIIKILPATGVDAVIDSVQGTVDDISQDIAPDQITEDQKQKIDTAVDSILQVDNEELMKHEGAMDTVEKLENLAVKANDKVSETVVDSQQMGNVSVSGAGLTAAEAARTAAEGQSLAAKISVERSRKSYEEEYGKDAYALNIEMSIVDTRNNNTVVPGMEDIQPKTPIQITLTVPENLRGRELKLVHVSDERVQSEIPYTSGQEGSTISFTVASLSDFVLVPGKCTGEHSWDEGKVTAEPGCLTVGTKEYTCTKCGEKKTEELKALGHGFTVETEDKKAPTCTEEGYQVFKCERCDAIWQKPLDKLSHDWKLTSENKATCSSEGNRIYTCTICKDTKNEIIPKDSNAHGYEWKTDRNPTCGKAGQRHQECKYCKAKGKTESIPATGKHKYGSWRTTRAATALVTGIQERTCSVCHGAKQTRSIAKLKPTIKLNVPQSKTLPLTLKKSFTVKVSGLAKGDSVKSWSSSNKKIVTVSSKGKLSAKKTGTVKITVTLRSGKTAWFKVKVQKTAVKTSKISGISKKITLNKGKKYTLKPVLTPVTTLDKVKYSTSNKKVATVNSRGQIVAKSAGRATITVTAGSKKVKITVTVPKVKTTKLSGVKTALTLKKGKTYRIKAKAYPTNTDEKITYTSSNKKIATVTSKGVIKAVKKGKVTITVKSGRKSIKMKLTVK